MNNGALIAANDILAGTRVRVEVRTSALRVIHHLSDSQIQTHSHCVRVAYAQESHYT